MVKISFDLYKPQFALRFFILVPGTSLALRYSKQLDREHFPGAFTGAQAEPAARDCRDHR